MNKKEGDKKKRHHLFFRYKYKKLTVLLISIIAAYIIFTDSNIGLLIPKDVNVISIFIAGIFFAFGFLAPFATGFFILIDPSSILFASIVASFGTLLGDLLIFKTIKISVQDEFERLEKSTAIKELNHFIDKSPLHKAKIYLYYSFIGIFIASPLPDEIGVSMVAGVTKIKFKTLAVISYVLHFIGFLILFAI